MTKKQKKNKRTEYHFCGACCFWCVFPFVFSKFSRIPTFFGTKSMGGRVQGIQGTPMEHIGSSTNGKRVATVEAMQSSSSERAKHLGKTAVKNRLKA